MNNNFETHTSQSAEKQVKFTVWKQAAFLVAAAVLPFIYAIGIAGAAGALLVPIAAAFNFLYAMHAGNSAVKLLLLLFANLVPFVGATVYFVSVSAAMPALVPLVLTLPIWLTVRRGLERSVSVAAAAICAAVLYFAMLALGIFERYGEINITTVTGAIDSIFAPVKEMFLSLIAEAGEDSGLNITETVIDNAIYYVKTMFFGMIAVGMIIMAYLSTLAIRVGAELMNMTYVLPKGVRIGMRMTIGAQGPQMIVSQETVLWRIEIDSVSAVMLIAAYIVSVLFASSESTGIPSIVAANLVLMLSPGFVYCGARDLVLGFSGKSSIGRASKLILIPAIALVFINPMLIFMLLCVTGIVVTFRENGARRRMEKGGKEQK